MESTNKKVFLVDCENASQYSFIKSDLNENDTIVFFTRSDSKELTMLELQNIIISKVNVKFEFLYEEEQSSNHMVAYLCMNLEDDTNYYIVSNDTGITSTLKFIKLNNPDVNIDIYDTPRIPRLRRMAITKDIQATINSEELSL